MSGFFIGISITLTALFFIFFKVLFHREVKMKFRIRTKDNKTFWIEEKIFFLWCTHSRLVAYRIFEPIEYPSIKQAGEAIDKLLAAKAFQKRKPWTVTEF